MERLFAQGHAIDVVLAVMLAEAAWLVARRRVAMRDVAGMMLPGALILLAARAALTGGDWPWIALPLALSFPAHLAEVARRGWLGNGWLGNGWLGGSRLEKGRLGRGCAAGARPSPDRLPSDQDCVFK